MHLKSQVNPHFFFNMLNSLYGLVDKDSKKAKELILKLSDILFKCSSVTLKFVCYNPVI